MGALCKIKVGPTREIIDRAKELQERGNLSSKDSLHVACALGAEAGYFLSCDDDLVKRANRLNLDITVLNPVPYCREECG